MIPEKILNTFPNIQQALFGECMMDASGIIGIRVMMPDEWGMVAEQNMGVIGTHIIMTGNFTTLTTEELLVCITMSDDPKNFGRSFAERFWKNWKKLAALKEGQDENH